MTRYRRKNPHNKNKLYTHNRKKNPRGMTESKFLDQIYDDMENPEKANPLAGDPDVTGFGKYYCIGCSRYFSSETSLKTHEATKTHKRRMKQLNTEEVYRGPTVIIDNGLKKPETHITLDPDAASAFSDPLDGNSRVPIDSNLMTSLENM